MSVETATLITVAHTKSGAQYLIHPGGAVFRNGHHVGHLEGVCRNRRGAGIGELEPGGTVRSGVRLAVRGTDDKLWASTPVVVQDVETFGL